MANRIFACALLTLLAPSTAWAHRCGLPYQFKMNKGSTAEYAITGDHAIDYVVVAMGDKGVATIEPTKINQQEDGKFKIMGLDPGNYTIHVEYVSYESKIIDRFTLDPSVGHLDIGLDPSTVNLSSESN